MKQSIKYGTTIIEYNLEYSDRKTLGIKVHPDSRVDVIAPTDSTNNKIKEKVKSKAHWILKQQDYFISFRPLTPPRKFISGETHLYLGKQYRLKVKQSKEESVKLIGGNIIIKTTTKKDKERIEKQLCQWYESKAKKHFKEIFDKWISIYPSNKLKNPSLALKWMKKRWGSCDQKGKIKLNAELIKAPKPCIEYVMVHEICHLTYLNHSKDFYKLLDKHYPHWRKIKTRLEHFMA
jgi:predicted metal-dependent hydrolase